MGILINERKLMSLSRFQMALWTLMILSAYFTMAVGRIKAGVPNPLAIEIDPQLWAVLGISTASLIGSPLISSVKKGKEPAQATELTDRVGKAFDEAPAVVEKNREGVLYGNENTSDAAFTDMQRQHEGDLGLVFSAIDELGVITGTELQRMNMILASLLQREPDEKE